MQILKRARGENDGEIVPAYVSDSDMKDEVNRRTHKAGYTDRDGQPKISRNNGAGKGDVFRPVDKKKYDAECERLGLGTANYNVWPRDSDGNLIND